MHEQQTAFTQPPSTQSECESTTIQIHVPVNLEEVIEQVEPSSSSSASNNAPPILYTKLAKAIDKCLKPSTESVTSREIQELDILRHKLKTSGTRHTMAIRSRYNALVELLVKKMSCLKDEQVQAIRTFEKSYFVAHKTLPERDTIVEYESRIHKKNLTSKLIQLIVRDART